MRKASKMVATLLTVLALMVCIVILPTAFGRKVLVVVSGSMQPVLPVGSLVYVCPVSPENLSPGEICTWQDTAKGILVTHRVLRVDAAERLLWTKGDANQNADEPVCFSDVVGRVENSLPAVGWLILLLRTPLGVLLLCAAAIASVRFLDGRRQTTEQMVKS